jgi:hypothetical protein
MNLKDEINALADEWGKPTITEAKTIPEMVKMARENEKMLCAIQLKTLITKYLLDSCHDPM